MAKELVQAVENTSSDPVLSEFLELCSDHKLQTADFQFLSGKKKTLRRINAVATAALLLKESYFKHIKICLHTRTSYMYTPLGSIYGPFKHDQVKLLLTSALGKVGIPELTKPGYIDSVFRVLKDNSKISATGPVLLHKGTLPK